MFLIFTTFSLYTTFFHSSLFQHLKKKTPNFLHFKTHKVLIMSKPNLKSFIILLVSSLCIFIRGGAYNLPSNNRKLLNLVTKLDDPLSTLSTIGGALNNNRKLVRNSIKSLDDLYTPSTTPTPITNPANFPPNTPTIVTIPSSSNPINTYPNPITTSNPPVQTSIASGQTWCVAKSGTPDSSLQTALDYTCGIGGADCSSIQQGASCYNPNSLGNHASVAFNSYFQKNPVPTSCDFGGVAMIVTTNPSSGSCIFPSSGGGAGTAASTFPPATASSTGGASGSPYGGGNGSPYDVPASGSYGSPPSFMNPSDSGSSFPTSDGPDNSTPTTTISFPAGAVTASDSIRPSITFTFTFTFILLLAIPSLLQS